MLICYENQGNSISDALAGYYTLSNSVARYKMLIKSVALSYAIYSLDYSKITHGREIESFVYLTGSYLLIDIHLLTENATFIDHLTQLGYNVASDLSKKFREFDYRLSLCRGFLDYVCGNAGYSNWRELI